MRHLHAGDEAVIDLLLLVAVDRIVEEEREVRDQVEVVAEAVGRDLGQRLVAAVLPLRADAVAIGVAAVGRVDRAEAVDQPVVDRALRRGFGGVPLAVVAHDRDARGR